MEPLKGGMLTSDASPIASLLRGANPNASMASWALRFVAQLDGVFVTLSGMSAYEQMKDNISIYSGIKPLSNDEQAVLEKAVGIINSIPRIDCTACRYCVNDCPSKILIPMLLDIYNSYLIHQTTTNLDHGYKLWTRNAGKAGDCVACRVCEGICPQKLEIADTMTKISALLD